MTREELIGICEKAIVTEDNWHDRDSSGAIAQVGKAWALLKAGCEFKVITKDNINDFEFLHHKESDIMSDERTIWIEIFYKGFNFFEGGDQASDTFYLPTDEALEHANGGDWY